MATTPLKTFEEYIAESTTSDYAREHTAPGVDDTAPLHNVIGIYAEDIYSDNALRLYGWNNDPSIDMGSIAIIQACHHKPEKLVKVYRAVPDVNQQVDAQIRAIRALFTYKEKNGRYPVKSPIIRVLSNKYSLEDYLFGEQQQLIKKELLRQVEELEATMVPSLEINDGDWVSISKAYAKFHGISNLDGKFKILSKVVPAKCVFTDGNDLNEWGYNEVD